MSLPDDLEQNQPDSSKAESQKKPRRKRQTAPLPPPSPSAADFWPDLSNPSIDDAIPDWLKADLDSNETREALPDWLQPPPSNATLEGDELPSWLKTPVPDGPAGKNVQRSDDWETTGVLPPPSSAMGSPEDLDWLDEMPTGKGLPLDELPTLNWGEEGTAGISSANDLSWLDELALQHPPPKEGDADLDWLTADAPPEPLIAITSDTLDKPDGALLEEVPDDLEAAMAWLEKLAARQGAPLDELPTVTKMPSGYQPVAAEEEIMPASVALPVEPEPILTESVPADVLTADIPDDLEAMMAWLEQLAARQGAPLEELPSISATTYQPPVLEVELEPTTTDQATNALLITDIPDDPEAAMAWLEKLAARQGAPLEELPTMSETPIEVPQPVETAIESFSLEDFASQIPDDPEAAMAWLEQLAARQGAPLEELPTVQATAPPLPPPPSPVELPSTKPVQPDVPDDLESAMAWLEQLAARQGAPLEELPTVPERLEEVEMPAWLREMPPSQPPAMALDPDIPRDSDTLWLWLINLALTEDEEPSGMVVEAEEELPDWLQEEMPAQSTSPEPEPALELSIPEELATQNIADSLPDWLSLDTIQDTSWLDSLPTTTGDPDSWLASEEQAATKFDQRMELAEIESLLEPAPSPSTPEIIHEEGPVKVPLTVQMPALSPTTTEPEATLLNSARHALSEGDYATAMQNYETLVRAGNGLPTLIADLELASSRHRRQPLLRRLLADAYMHQGDLPKALDTYRQVLDIL